MSELALPWESPEEIRRQRERSLREGRWWITLPLLKPLSMNDSPSTSRGARMGRNNEIQQVREDTHQLCKVAGVAPCRMVRVTLVYEPPELNALGRRMNPRRDPLNLTATLKPAQDGIVDAGVVPDDTPQYMESPMPIIDLPRLGSMHGRLQVLIERMA